MNTTQFIDANLQDAEQRQEFSDLNALDHDTTHDALLRLGIVVEKYALAVDELNDDWKQVHFAEHTAWGVALNLGLPPDLSEVDFDDRSQTDDWMQLHTALHIQVNQVLGLQ